jgi:hypothetical protein
MDLPDDQGGYHRVWPFRRSWVAITILAVMDIAFLVPAILTFREVIGEWGSFDSLFGLVTALFMSAWLLGWLMAPLIMTAILLVMLFGREALKVHPGTVELFLGFPYLGLMVTYDVTKMRNLRVEQPLKKSGTSWRGKHFVFDYGANTVSFGSDVNSDELAQIENSIQMVSGTAIRSGEALPEEVAVKWEPEADESPVTPMADPVSKVRPVTLSSASTLVLIIANMVPIAGTVFLGWKLSDVMVLYWAESAVIGFFTICKIIVIGRWMALLAGPFFLGHFGGFMAIHFLFIYTIFVKGPEGMNASGSDLSDVTRLFVILWPALAALVASHTYSFFANFLGRGEYRKSTVKEQMSKPYGRIVFMQLVLIFGGGISMILGQIEPVLIAVIGLKIYFDVKAHIKEHARSPY